MSVTNKTNPDLPVDCTDTIRRFCRRPSTQAYLAAFDDYLHSRTSSEEAASSTAMGQSFKAMTNKASVKADLKD